MPRYIDVDKLLNEIDKLKKSPWYNNDYDGQKQARQERVNIVVDLCIKRTPIADVQEARHGEWYDICDNHQQSNYQEEAYGTCSVCKVRGRLRTNRDEYGIWFIDSPYCPNCGAKMDGKREDEYVKTN